MLTKFRQRLQNSELYKNILLLISGNGLAQIIPLLVYPIITRLFTPDDFGVLAFLFSIHSIILIISTGRFNLAIILPKKNREANALFNTGMSLALVMGLLIPVLVFLLGDLTAPYIEYEDFTIWLYLLGITVLVTAFAIMMDGWCTRYKLFRIIVIYTLTLNLSTSLLKLIFGLLNIENGLLLAFVIAQTSASIIYFVAVRQKHLLPKFKLFKKIDLRISRDYLNFPRYNMPHALINTISSNLPVLILTFYFSEYYTGQFAVAFALLFKPVQVYAGSVSQALSQKVVELKNKNLLIWPLLSKYLKRTFFMAIIPAIILFIIAPELFRIVLGENWLDAGKICRLLIPWPLAVLHGGSLAFIPNVFNKQLKALVIDIIYLFLRMAALAVGVITDNIFLGIGLFSLTGFFVIGYAVIWYIGLVKQHDKKVNNR